jgi:hypothetical protein
MSSVARSTRSFGFSWWVALSLLFVSGASGEARRVADEVVSERLSGLNIPFIANSGQTDPAVAYYAQTFAGTVFVTRDGRIVYSLPGVKASASGGLPSIRKAGWSLAETPVGGRARPSGSERASTRVSYFLGNDPTRWSSDLPAFEGVSLGEVWPGISLALRARGKNVEKLFTVEPGGDPSRIRMRVRGGRSLRVNAAMGLVIETGLGDVTFTPPVAFQEQGGVRHPVNVAYELRGKEYGFRLGGYDSALPVVIDPLVQSTYLGGGNYDKAWALATSATGDVYVAGETFTGIPYFPQGTIYGAYSTPQSTQDAFVARLDATLTVLKGATYLGGSGNDAAFALAIHPISRNVYVAGQTSSTNFPGTPNGAQNAFAGNGGPWLIGDAFVASLSADLTTLIQATYLGGSNDDAAYALAINPTSGDVYVAGQTFSNDFFSNFMAGGAQSSSYCCFLAFVARLDQTLKNTLPNPPQATYLGAPVSGAYALAIHPTTLDVYVAGYTLSDQFPHTTGGAQPTCSFCTIPGHGADAFVARLNAALTNLIQATYVGGDRADIAYALAIPPSGDVYVAGSTNSASYFFSPSGQPFSPFLSGGAQQANSGSGTFFDAFVVRLDKTLTDLSSNHPQATYLGGHMHDYGYAMAIHPTSGDVYVAGKTDNDIPGYLPFPFTTNAAQSANGGGWDAFVARLDATLTDPGSNHPQATFLGGSGDDIAQALAIDPTCGDVYVAGYTESPNFPGTTGSPAGAQPARNGYSDAFVARFSPNLKDAPPQVCLPCAQPPSGMISWWPANGNANDVWGGHNGILQGVNFTPAKVGQGFTSFAQNTYVEVPDSQNLNFGAAGPNGAGNLSIDAWISNGSAPARAAQILPIVDKRDLPPDGSVTGYFLFLFNGRLAFQLGAGTFFNYISSSLLPDLRDGRFHHVAVTVDRNSPTGGHLYVDGGPPVLTFDPTNRLGSLTNIKSLFIGRHAADPAITFLYKGGLIDEVELFNSAISQVDIQRIVDADSTGKCKLTCAPRPSGMVAYWPLDETAGTKIVDIVGNHNATAQPAAIGAGPATQPGMVGTSLFFAGGQRVEVPATLALEPGTGDFSIDAWVNYSANALNDFRTIVEKYPTTPPGSRGYLLGIKDVGMTLGKLQLLVAMPAPFMLTADITPYTWHHVAWTLERGTTQLLKLYLDGAQVDFASVVPPGTTVSNIFPLHIGGSGRGIAVDEVELFNRSLDQTEIAQLFHAGPLGKCGCMLVANDNISCNPDGSFNYSFTVTNLSSTSTVSQVTFSAPAGMTITPGSIPIPPLLPGTPGGSTTVPPVTINGPADGDTICFTVMLVEQGTGTIICKTDHCLTLPSKYLCERKPRDVSFR